MSEERDKQPAYGMLAFRRVHGGDANLFGSSVEHDAKIQLTLKEGSVSRHLSNDWYYGERRLFQVEMSYTQFAELISAMNVGDGVPVTIRYTENSGRIPGIQTVNKRTQFLDEFKEQNKDSAVKVKELTDKLIGIFEEKRPIKAKERDDILAMLKTLAYAVDDHNSFVLDQFNESMEHIVTEAKGEVEAFVQNKMHSLALAALRENNLADLSQVVPAIDTNLEG